MARTVRWGILGTGSIAHKFAAGLQSAAGAELAAVGSRTKRKADKFGHEFGIRRRHGSYADLAEDGEVDAVYVATPHPFHLANSAVCLQAGKAVLCEKPLTVNASQAERLIGIARDREVFLMEAMWTRFLPSMVKLRELLAANAIGEVRMVIADFAFRAKPEPTSRLFNPELAGGGLLDVGIYPLSLASMILGRPEDICGQAHIGPSGVDEQAAVVGRYQHGRIAVAVCGARTETQHEAWIIGTEGNVHLHPPWWKATRISLKAGGKTRDFELPMEGNGYNYEAEEVMRCIAEGKTESDVMPLDESLTLMETMDRIRAQWGLKYPME